jgi:hypothetical protein
MVKPIRRIPITPGDLKKHDIGTDDSLAGAPNSTNLLYGDAGGNFLDHAIGGNDTITGPANSTTSSTAMPVMTSSITRLGGTTR